MSNLRICVFAFETGTQIWDLNFKSYWIKGFDSKLKYGNYLAILTLFDRNGSDMKTLSTF